MSQLSTDQMLDLLQSTQEKFDKPNFTDISQDLQYYEVMSRIFPQEKQQQSSGTKASRRVQVSYAGGVRHVGYYEVDSVNQADHLKDLTVPMSHTTGSHSYDIKEDAMNQGPEEIVDLMAVRRNAVLVNYAEFMETDFWGKPNDIGDDKVPFGMEYWCVQNETEGFNGGAPVGFPAGAGGLLHDHWKNYTGEYATIDKTSDTGLIKMMRRAARKTKFISPHQVKGKNPDVVANAYRIYVNEDTISQFEDLGEAQNENLGRDLASMDGEMTFHKNPIVYVPKLDAETNNPVYMLNFRVIYPIVMKGRNMRESKPEKSPTQHDVIVVFIDLSWNVVCENRRALTVFTQAA